jgi:nitroreductase
VAVGSVKANLGCASEMQYRRWRRVTFSKSLTGNGKHHPGPSGFFTRGVDGPDMDVRDAILERRSVRSYADRPLSRETIETVLDSVRMAPSASNRQDWRFVVADDEATIQVLYEAAEQQDFVLEAGAVIAGVATDPETEMTCGMRAGVVDVSIALDHLMLRAAEEGLGTCWLGAFDQDESREILGVSEDEEIVALLTIGYPQARLRKVEKDRKPLDEVVSYVTGE